MDSGEFEPDGLGAYSGYDKQQNLLLDSAERPHRRRGFDITGLQFAFQQMTDSKSSSESVPAIATPS